MSKELAALIIGKMKPKPRAGEEDSDSAMEEEDLGLETAMEEFIAAVKEDKPKSAVEAFKSLVDLCHGYSEGDDEMEE